MTGRSLELSEDRRHRLWAQPDDSLVSPVQNDRVEVRRVVGICPPLIDESSDLGFNDVVGTEERVEWGGLF
jgi:hypothetical protein